MKSKSLAIIAAVSALWVGTAVQSPAQTASGQAVTWTDLTGVALDGNGGLIKTAAGGQWDAGAASVERLDGDGGIEFTATETNKRRMIGLSTNNPDAGFSSIGSAIFLRNNGSYSIFENGSGVPNVGGAYQTGDVFRIERVGGTVSYVRNGSPVHVRSETSNAPLLVDVSFLETGATVPPVRIVLEIPVLPNDIPPAPANAISPGGLALPSMNPQLVAGAPAIAMASESTLPDESLAIAGENLDGARLLLWAEGITRHVEPLATAPDKMLATVPKDFPPSTMLVWPVKDGKVGAPFRVNGATAWWAYPRRLVVRGNSSAEKVQIMGKNLAMEGRVTGVFLEGTNTALALGVEQSSAYSVTANLPPDLPAGVYRLYVHNGSGGIHGWSEAVEIDIVNKPGALTAFPVAGYGAQPDDGIDDTAAIQAAIAAAQQAGGGIVEFAAGTYHVTGPIQTTAATALGVTFAGAGMGNYNPVNSQVSGTHTTIMPLPGVSASGILRLNHRFDDARDLSLINHHPGTDADDASAKATEPPIAVLRARAADQKLLRVRLVLLDARDYSVPLEQRPELLIYDPCLHIMAASVDVTDCEFHSAGCGVQIGFLIAGNGSTASVTERGHENISIDRCLFRGYSRGLFARPADGFNGGAMGRYANGVVNLDGKQVRIENCDFAGANKAARFMMNRTFQNFNSSNRELYFAHNNSHNVGQIHWATEASPPDSNRFDMPGQVNQGEQVIFHYRYPHGGFFDVVNGGSDWLEIDPNDPRSAGTFTTGAETVETIDRAGSEIHPQLGQNRDWLAYITAGRGVGQFRVISGRTDPGGLVRLTMEKPWRVAPDATSRVILHVANREVAIVGNTIDAGLVDPNSKTLGILFWTNCGDNIAADNTIRNTGAGVAVTSWFRSPSYWNLIRGNIMEDMRGFSAGESQFPSFISTTHRISVLGGDDPAAPAHPLVDGDPVHEAEQDVQSWFSVGNAYRSNWGVGATRAAFIHGAAWHNGARQTLRGRLFARSSDPGSGMMLEVMENNQFFEVTEGIVINPAASWLLLRNNRVETLDPGAGKIVDESAGDTTSVFVATTFQLWKLANGLAESLTPANDDDHDGLPLLLEYALGTDPAAHSSSPFTAALQGGWLTLTYPRAKAAADITILAEVSGDLVSWSGSAADVVQQWQIIAGTPQQFIVTALDQTPSPPASRRFIRLRTTLP